MTRQEARSFIIQLAEQFDRQEEHYKATELMEAVEVLETKSKPIAHGCEAAELFDGLALVAKESAKPQITISNVPVEYVIAAAKALEFAGCLKKRNMEEMA